MTMDTLFLTKIKTTTVERTNLWFDKFSHSVLFNIKEASALRNMSHKSIDQYIKWKIQWGSRSTPNYGGSWRELPQNISLNDTTINNLRQLCDFFIEDKRDRKISISRNTVTVYTNDKTLITDISELNFINHSKTHIRNLKQVGIPNTIRKQQSDYKFRSYFRHSRISLDQMSRLRNFLTAQEDCSLSPALKAWMTQPKWRHLEDYFYLDHNCNSIVTMMVLFMPRIIRKTVPIVTDK
jgi:hypothetical protein